MYSAVVMLYLLLLHLIGGIFSACYDTKLVTSSSQIVQSNGESLKSKLDEGSYTLMCRDNKTVWVNSVRSTPGV